MSFSIPRQKLSDMVLHIWKIINLPCISFNDLLYKITFELFFYNPKEAEKFITNAIKSRYLIQDENNHLQLSENLNSELKNWQKNRENEILQNFNSIKRQNEFEYQFQQNSKSTFNNLLKRFSDKQTLNRAVSISGSAFKFQLNNLNKGLIKATVAGSKDQPYIIEINSNNKNIIHNCQDFQTRKSKEKRFCKHLIRLFLLLKEQDELSSVSLLKKISAEIEEWYFSS